MTAPVVLFERRGAVGEIVLNRPEQMNAMNFALIEGIAAAVRQCRDPEIRAVVMRGNGRCFSAGGDIRAFHQMIEEGKSIPAEMPDKLHLMVEELRQLEKPVLASVHAAAAGAGTPLALACDLVIAAKDAIFNVAYARIGLTGDGSSTYFLPRHVGMKKAAELFMTIPTLTADEAAALGLVNWVVPPAELRKKTDAIADQLAAGPTKVYGRIKRLLNASYHNNLHDQLALETEMICTSSQEADFREGIKAFLAKRPPTFSGS